MYIGISTVSDLNAFFVLTQKTADGWAFGDPAKGNVKPTGRETPAETEMCIRDSAYSGRVMGKEKGKERLLANKLGYRWKYAR